MYATLSGYLWLNRPHKKQKWKRVFTCLYSSPTLTYLVWWSNRHENQIKGFVLLNDFDVVHYLANSICIKPVRYVLKLFVPSFHIPHCYIVTSPRQCTLYATVTSHFIVRELIAPLSRFLLFYNSFAVIVTVGRELG